MSVICTFENEAKKIRSLTKKLCELNQYIIEEERSPFFSKTYQCSYLFYDRTISELGKRKRKNEFVMYHRNKKVI